ncbi:hypothetical protein MPSEU_000737100 [Mayamaea pseudoterrestris]|nr:hypothetical protein MPSEU_000737100 [Mayamaea pseudoterrestris]
MPSPSSSENNNDAATPVTPPANKTATLIGDQSIGGTVYIRPRPEADLVFAEENAPTPKALASSFAAADDDKTTVASNKTNDEANALLSASNTSADSAIISNVPSSDPTTTDPVDSSAVSSSDEPNEAIDEELKMAEALALAIQSNPNMSPEEIKQLIGVKASVVKDASDANKANSSAAPSQQQASLQALAEKQQQAILAAGQKMSSFFQAAVENSSENAKKASNQGQETFKALSKSISNFTAPVAMKWTSGSSTSNLKPDGSGDPVSNMLAASRETSGVFSVAPTNDAAELSTALKPPSTTTTSTAGGKASPVASERSNAVLKSVKNERLRLSGLAWKRRGGMGKFTASAWELRRFELRGTKLMYFSEKGILLPDGGDEASIVTTNSFEEHKDLEGISVAKRATWLDQAAATWSAAPSDPASPRGDMDLAKEKAVVQVSYGHSGAPSPFALSIKVGSDTKWKLCFNQHKTLMTWLAALSDVVVQCSVDQYNANLLAAADPSYQGDVSAVLLPPSVVNKPPAIGAEKDVNRLWMCEKFAIGNVVEDSYKGDEAVVAVGTTGDLSDVDLDESTRSLLDFEPSEETAIALDHSAARAAAEDNSEKVWSIPAHNLRWLAGLVNAGLFLARSSSTPTEGFWYIFLLTNIGFYLCLVKEPSWQSLLQHVKATAQPSVAGAVVPGMRLKSAAGVAVVASATTLPLAKPIAGTTTVQLKEPRDPPVNAKGEHFAAWRAVPGDGVLVRSHGYNSTKAKVPSPGELYELVKVDIFESPHRYPDMASRVVLPKCDFDDGGKPKTWRTPDIFVISLALPTDPPSAFAKTSSDGGGYTITMYYRMHKDTREILRRVTADGYDPSQEKLDDPQKSKVNAARLLEEWVRRAPSDPKYQARFKVVSNAHNLDEIGMPSWISKYNGKPFLVKRAGVTGFLLSHPELSCIEFDVSLHPFPYLCKQALSYMKDTYFKKVLVTFGFTIEGRADDEVRVLAFTKRSPLLLPMSSLSSSLISKTQLPECVIGLMQLCYPDPAHAIQADKFFAGTAPKSF